MKCVLSGEIVKSGGVELVAMSLQSLDIPEGKRRAIEAFVRELRERYGERVKRVILFGSVARGDYHEESDIDVLVIADEVDLRDISRIATRILLRHGEVISPIVRSEEDFQARKAFSFYRAVMEEGVKLA